MDDHRYFIRIILLFFTYSSGIFKLDKYSSFNSELITYRNHNTLDYTKTLNNIKESITNIIKSNTLQYNNEYFQLDIDPRIKDMLKFYLYLEFPFYTFDNAINLYYLLESCVNSLNNVAKNTKDTKVLNRLYGQYGKKQNIIFVSSTKKFEIDFIILKYYFINNNVILDKYEKMKKQLGNTDYFTLKFTPVTQTIYSANIILTKTNDILSTKPSYIGKRLMTAYKNISFNVETLIKEETKAKLLIMSKIKQKNIISTYLNKWYKKMISINVSISVKKADELDKMFINLDDKEFKYITSYKYTSLKELLIDLINTNQLSDILKYNENDPEFDIIYNDLFSIINEIQNKKQKITIN
jgi:hypothetical protein